MYLPLYQISPISVEQFWKHNMGADRCIQFIGFVIKTLKNSWNSRRVIVNSMILQSH